MSSLLVGLPQYANAPGAFYQTVTNAAAGSNSFGILQQVPIAGDFIVIPVLLWLEVKTSAVVANRAGASQVLDGSGNTIWQVISPVVVTANQTVDTLFDVGVGSSVTGRSATVIPLPNTPLFPGWTWQAIHFNSQAGDTIPAASFTFLRVPTDGHVLQTPATLAPAPLIA